MGYSFEQRDFENPSMLFRMEDSLKNLVGGPLMYDAYYRKFNLRGNEKVLDFGCGGGSGAKRLASLLKQGGSLTCVDSSSYWISLARKRTQKFGNVQCLLGNIDNLELPDSSFDIITATHVIHDIPPEKRQLIVSSLSKKLKPGGIFYLKEPIRESHGMPAKEIQTIFSAAGLKELEYSVTKTEYTGKFCRTD